MCLLIFLAIVTNKRKLQPKACKKTPSLPFNDSLSLAMKEMNKSHLLLSRKR